MRKVEKLNRALKLLDYQSITLGNKVIAGYNGETIIVEATNDLYVIKIGFNETDVLRKQTVKRKLHKTVVNIIIEQFDEAETMRDHYTKLWKQGEAPFFESKWLSQSYYRRLVLS